MRKLMNFLKDERGLETVEWAVIAALIVAGIVTIVTTLGDNVVARFGDLEAATR